MPRRQGRRDFGSIRERSNGRHQASYWHDGKLHHAPYTFATRGDASDYLAGIQTDIKRGGWIDPHAGDETLKHYANRWLPIRTRTKPLQPRTVELYRYLLDNHILPSLGERRLSAIKPEAVANWYAELAIAHPTTAAKAYRLLSTICSTAVKNELILRSPCRVDGAGREHAPERPTVSLAEVDALAKAMPERLRLLVYLAMWNSFRRGELLALRRRDVDELHSSVRIERAAQHLASGEVLYGPPKSTASTRTVYYPDVIAGHVRQHLEQHVGPDPDALLFTAVNGKPLPPSRLQEAWKRARLKIKRPELHLHDLRHTGATFAAVSGATTKELMGRLGHDSPRAALIYQHRTDDRDKAVAALMSDLAKQAPIVAIDGTAQDRSRPDRAQDVEESA